jgi:2-polyprenyl-3-methyl-5-hydroxy-6-metoxy-1,4-benzoquinol methylase
MGFEVSGFDITPSCIEAATRLGAAYRLSHRIRFSIQTAERVDYPDESFDVVAGIDILHHVEIPAAVAEYLRVLKLGGNGDLPGARRSSGVRSRKEHSPAAGPVPEREVLR